jgi:hypothetical protein
MLNEDVTCVPETGDGPPTVWLLNQEASCVLFANIERGGRMKIYGALAWILLVHRTHHL